MSRHVERLFSAAYDGELSPQARAGFDRHLAECPACAAAFAELTTAVDVLREQGPARMPRPVRLPEGSPAAQRGLSGLLARPRWGHGLTGGLAAAGMVAAVAGVTAVVVVGHLNPGLETRSPTAGYSAPLEAGVSHGSAAQPVAGVNGGAGACPGAGCPSPTVATVPVGTCAATALGTSAASAAEIPTGFNNRDSNDDGTTRVVIATQASSFTPGETVDVYARVIDDDTGAVYLPCTSLEAAVSGSSNALALPFEAILATPAPGIAVGGEPVLQVTLPVSTATGQTYQIVVEVPVSAGEARQVSLSINVT